MDGDVVRPLGQRPQRDALDAERLEPRVVHVGVVGDHRRLERGDATGEGAADVAQAHDADGLAVQRARVGAGHATAPGAGVHLPVERDDLAVPRQQQGQRVVGDLAHPDVGDVHDDHAQLGGGGDVDHVVADAGARDDLQPLQGAHDVAGDGRGGGQARGDVGERGPAVGVVPLAAPLDDVDVIRPVGHDGSVVYRRRR